MIRDWNTILQALVASLFTWGVTALGAGVVFLIPPYSKILLDVSLGFAAGVMTAASFWSLLAPAIELAESSVGALAFLPVAIGFAAGAGFVYIADRIMPSCVLSNLSVVDLMTENVSSVEVSKSVLKSNELNDENKSMIKLFETNNTTRIREQDSSFTNDVDVGTSEVSTTTVTVTEPTTRATEKERAIVAAISWRRIVLLIIAVTVHNIPEGLAVGVAFGSIGKAAKATFESAYTLSLGIGLQNFPEGLAVSLPLVGFGHSKLKSFFYGQLSGMVEPIAALGGAVAVILMEPVLPYALSFAAGAMIYVVVDDIIPEAQRNGNGKLASLGAIAGFLVMMSLDVGLG